MKLLISKKFNHKILNIGWWSYKNSTYIINFQISFTKNCNHAGFDFEIGILGYWFYIEFCDTRLWNRALNIFE